MIIIPLFIEYMLNTIIILNLKIKTHPVKFHYTYHWILRPVSY